MNQLALNITQINCIPDRGHHLEGRSGDYFFHIAKSSTRGCYFVTGLNLSPDGCFAEGTRKPVPKTGIESALGRFPVELDSITWQSVRGGPWSRNYFLQPISESE
ncbi:MAG: hypothetical protein OEZ68_12000 [Gammaproteobacteria bacterium]|nr:hypothetical protein [Gammaproteobacteria bacterium]MDH5801516.1 hypothetical protein [Gammaproteobacteria bacterium]